MREQSLLLCWGDGANGKTTLLNAIMDCIGTDFAGYAPVELLMATRGDQHPTLLADLFGKRLVVAAETEQGRRLNESRLKMLTGGEKIKARRMHENFWEFAPSHKLVLVTNHKPEVKGQDHAIWRRLRLVPFTARFIDPSEHPGQEIPERSRIDRDLPAKLAAEREGILAWLVDGCLAWQRNGLKAPSIVGKATAEYRGAQDVIQEFLEECCTTGTTDFRVRASAIYGRYTAWTKARGEEQLTQTRFGEALTEKGFTRQKSNGIWYLGVALAQDEFGTVE